MRHNKIRGNLMEISTGMQQPTLYLWIRVRGGQRRKGLLATLNGLVRVEKSFTIGLTHERTSWNATILILIVRKTTNGQNAMNASHEGSSHSLPFLMMAARASAKSSVSNSPPGRIAAIPFLSLSTSTATSAATPEPICFLGASFLPLPPAFIFL